MIFLMFSIRVVVDADRNKSERRRRRPLRRKVADQFVVRVVRRTSSARGLHSSGQDEDRRHHDRPGPQLDAPQLRGGVAPAQLEPQKSRVRYISQRKHPLVVGGKLGLVFVPPPQPEGVRAGRVFRVGGRLGTRIDLSAQIAATS